MFVFRLTLVLTRVNVQKTCYFPHTVHSALIGQLSQAWAGTAHFVFLSEQMIGTVLSLILA